MFPFTFQGKTFTSCELDRGSRQELTRPGLRWCATEVDSEGEMVQGKWEYCHAGCQEEEL